MEQECTTNQVEPETEFQPPNFDSDDEENEKVTHMSHNGSGNQGSYNPPGVLFMIVLQILNLLPSRNTCTKGNICT